MAHKSLRRILLEARSELPEYTLAYGRRLRTFRNGTISMYSITAAMLVILARNYDSAGFVEGLLTPAFIGFVAFTVVLTRFTVTRIRNYAIGVLGQFKLILPEHAQHIDARYGHRAWWKDGFGPWMPKEEPFRVKLKRLVSPRFVIRKVR